MPMIKIFLLIISTYCTSELFQLLMLGKSGTKVPTEGIDNLTTIIVICSFLFNLGIAAYLTQVEKEDKS